MGAYKYINETFQKEYKERDEDYRKRLVKWRKEGSIVRVENPTNIARARSLGWKAKKGIFVVRVKIGKGLRKRVNPKAGRKARHAYSYSSQKLSLQAIGEQRVARRYKNAEVVNSYWVGEDGQHKYYEVILADRSSKEIGEYLKNIVKRVGRAFRGLTSAGRKARGLRAKGNKSMRRRSKKKERKAEHKKK